MELAGVEQQMRKDGRETWQGIDDCPWDREIPKYTRKFLKSQHKFHELIGSEHLQNELQTRFKNPFSWSSKRQIGINDVVNLNLKKGHRSYATVPLK
jgi:hypothetical protein